ncbi:MAG: VOC family protein [bacterium]
MLKTNEAFSSFAVNDIQKAKEFYSKTLGVKVTEEKDMEGLLNLHIKDGVSVMVYHKPDHTPATFTLLNFPSDNVEEDVDKLTKQGVKFEQYDNEDIKTDEKGISRSDGMMIAWFKDPSGNIMSVLEM